MSDSKKYHSIDPELFLNQEMYYNRRPKVLPNETTNDNNLFKITPFAQLRAEMSSINNSDIDDEEPEHPSSMHSKVKK